MISSPVSSPSSLPPNGNTSPVPSVTGSITSLHSPSGDSSSNKDASESPRNSRNSPTSTNDIGNENSFSPVNNHNKREFALGPGGIPMGPALDLVLHNARNSNGGTGMIGSPVNGLFSQRTSTNNGFEDHASSFEKLALLRPQLGLPFFGMPSLKVNIYLH